MTDRKSKFKRALRELYASEKGIFVFQLNTHCGLTPSEAIEFIDTFSPKGLAVSAGDQRLILTPQAKEEILFLFQMVDDMEGPNVEKSYLQSRLTGKKWGLFDPYLPEARYLYVTGDIF